MKARPFLTMFCESMVANYVVPTVDEGFDKVTYLNMWGKEIEYRED
jgi:hypothetical protein